MESCCSFTDFFKKSSSDVNKSTPGKCWILTYNIFVRPVVNDGESDYKPERLRIFSET